VKHTAEEGERANLDFLKTRKTSLSSDGRGHGAEGLLHSRVLGNTDIFNNEQHDSDNHDFNIITKFLRSSYGNHHQSERWSGHN
jgi:hypothetical protein